MGYKQEIDKEKRHAEAKRIKQKYPDRVPVICERARNCTLQEIDKKKFLVPGVMSCNEFKYIIMKHLQKDEGDALADKSIYLFAGDRSAPKGDEAISEVYKQFMSDDEFLYMTYHSENTLGR